MKFMTLLIDLLNTVILAGVLTFAFLAYTHPDKLASIACTVTTTNVVDEAVCRLQQNLN